MKANEVVSRHADGNLVRIFKERTLWFRVAGILV
jgi:hypothetical protein